MKIQLLTLFLTLALSATAQITVEGTVCAPKGTIIEAYTLNQFGDREDITLRGKQNKWKVRYELRNLSHVIVFAGNGIERRVHVFTHNPFKRDIKHFELVDIDLEQKTGYTDMLLYLSIPNQYMVYVPGLTVEDADAFTAKGLHPLRIHTKTQK